MPERFKRADNGGDLEGMGGAVGERGKAMSRGTVKGIIGKGFLGGSRQGEIFSVWARAKPGSV